VWTIGGVSLSGNADESSRQVSASRIFSMPGAYPISLTVTNNCGGTGSANTVGGLPATITIVPAPPERPGIWADGDITNSGSIIVRGSSGKLHANGLLNTSGNVCADTSVSHTSSTAMNLSKIKFGASCATSAAVGTNVFYSQPKIAPEIIDVPAMRNLFRSQADFLFKADGNIYLAGSSAPMTAAQVSAAGLSGWSWSLKAKLWTYSSSTVIANGIYYMEGTNIKISNGGSSTSPPMVTLIAEGSILISNAPSFQPKLAGYGIVSANDVQISSKFGVSGNSGLVYAYGQIEFSNVTTVYGSIRAANFRRTDGTNGPDELDAGGQNLVVRASKGTITNKNVLTVFTP
jgi:hypothetical protein